MLDHFKRFLRLGLCPAKHDEVVGIPHVSVSRIRQCPVQFVEDDVRQQRRDYPALRCPNGCGLENPVLHDSGFEESLHNVKNVAVGHPLAYSRHYHLVGQVVEKAFDVGVQHVPVALLMQLDDLLQGAVAASPFAESV